MPWWISAVGGSLAAIATFVVTWAALRPSQRRFARRFTSRWVERAWLALTFCYFVWLDISFVVNAAPIRRMEVLTLVVANAVAVVLLILLLLLRVMSQALDRRAARWKDVLDRLEALETASLKTGKGPTS